MSTSFRLSQEHNAQTVIWFVASGSWRLLRWAAWGAWLALDAFGGLCQYLQLVIVVGGALLGVMGLVAAAVACVPLQFWLCLAGLVVGAYVTYPRPKGAR